MVQCDGYLTIFQLLSLKNSSLLCLHLITISYNEFSPLFARFCDFLLLYTFCVQSNSTNFFQPFSISKFLQTITYSFHLISRVDILSNRNKYRESFKWNRECRKQETPWWNRWTQSCARHREGFDPSMPRERPYGSSHRILLFRPRSFHAPIGRNAIPPCHGEIKRAFNAAPYLRNPLDRRPTDNRSSSNTGAT